MIYFISFIFLLICAFFVLIFSFRKKVKILKEQLNWYQLLTNRSNIGIYKWDSGINKWYWGSTLFKIRGYEQGDKSEAITNFLLNVHPEDRARLVISTSESQKNKTPLSCAYRYVLPNGDIRFHDENSAFLSDGNLYGSVVDITDFQKFSELRDLSQFSDPVTMIPNKSAFDRKLWDLFVGRHERNEHLLLAFVSFDIISEYDVSAEEINKILLLISDYVNKSNIHNLSIYRTNFNELAILVESNMLDSGNDYILLVHYINELFDFVGKIDSNYSILSNAGISKYPNDSSNVSDLLAHADSALQSARRAKSSAIYDYLP